MATLSSDIKLDTSLVNDEAADVRRCLGLLYTTPKGSMPLARDFGLDTEFLDYPTETAKSLMAAEIIKQTAEYETRVTVSGVTWEATDDGKIQAKVAVASV